MSYDRKFRECVLAHVDAGKSQEEVRKMFALGVNTITQWKKLREETGSLENRPLERTWRKIDPEKLQADVLEKPDDFDEERAARFGCSRTGIQSARKKLKITRKKKTINYVERNEAEREEFMRKLEAIPEEKRVYIDETGKNTDLDRKYGYAPRGVKVEGETHGRKPDRLNIVAAKCGKEIIERHEYGCNMNSRLFEFWFALLLMCAVVGSVFIMDNASFHRKKVLIEMAEKAGFQVLFLPSYSPDLNPIENEWANLKTFLRNHGRDFEFVSDAAYHYFNSA